MPAQHSKEKKKIFVKPDRYIITLGIIAFACMICEGTMFDWSVFIFEKVVHAPADLTRLDYVAFIFTMTIGTVYCRLAGHQDSG